MADTSQEYENVLKKAQTKAPVTYREFAVAIANDEKSLLKFITENDPGQLAGLLHHSDAKVEIGKGLDFKPNAKQVGAQMLSLYNRKDWDTLNDILSNFVINMGTQNYTTDKKLIECLKDIEAIQTTQDGYKFTLRFHD